MVHINDWNMATLRAYLIGDVDRALRGFERLRPGSAVREILGYQDLLASAFIVAARRHFGRTYTRAEIVLYVAAVRQRDLVGGDFDPLSGEILILRALGASDDVRLHPVQRMIGQLSLLEAFVRDAGLDEKQIDGLLEEARSNAPAWLQKDPGAGGVDVESAAEAELETVSTIFLPGADRPVFSFAGPENFEVLDGEGGGTRFGTGPSGESFLWLGAGSGGVYVQADSRPAFFVNSRLEFFTASLVSLAALSAPSGKLPTDLQTDGDGYLRKVERVRDELGTIDPLALQEGAWWPAVLNEFAKAVVR